MAVDTLGLIWELTVTPASTQDRAGGVPLIEKLRAAVRYIQVVWADSHFDTALRGYRMDQVDRVLDTLQDRIAEQERELASLRPAAAAPAAVQRPEPEHAQEPEHSAHGTLGAHRSTPVSDFLRVVRVFLGPEIGRLVEETGANT